MIVSLGRRYRVMASYTGFVLLLVGLYTLAPLATALAWPADTAHWWGFLIPGGVLIVVGGLLWKGCRIREHVALTTREGGVIVLASWTAACLLSAYPFMRELGLNFTQAVFESVSGWTTTGLSVVDVVKAPAPILLWRSLLQLAGGCGLAIIMLAAIAGPSGTGISGAEGRTDQLAPHVRKSAKLVLTMYSCYAAVGILAYHLAGLSWFDAVNHAFTAVATGGFSTQPESIGHWDSLAVEAVSYGLMIMGSLNFLTAYLLWSGKFRAVARNIEIRVLAAAALSGALLLYWFTSADLYPGLGKQVRVAVFEGLSALTGTGFSTTSYAGWNGFGHLILIVLMCLGGGTCSTSGGLKQFRVGVLWLGLYWEVKRALLPRRAVTDNHVWFGEGKSYINDARLREVGTFLFMYLVVLLAGSAVLMAHGFGLKESLFEYASALGTVGLSVGLTRAEAPSAVLWAQTIGMFLGRLEFFVVFVALAKLVRDSRELLGLRKKRASRP